MLSFSVPDSADVTSPHRHREPVSRKGSCMKRAGDPLPIAPIALCLGEQVAGLVASCATACVYTSLEPIQVRSNIVT